LWSVWRGSHHILRLFLRLPKWLTSIPSHRCKNLDQSTNRRHSGTRKRQNWSMWSSIFTILATRILSHTSATWGYVQSFYSGYPICTFPLRVLRTFPSCRRVLATFSFPLRGHRAFDSHVGIYSHIIVI
jgi:hypothetical protein